MRSTFPSQSTQNTTARTTFKVKVFQRDMFFLMAVSHNSLAGVLNFNIRKNLKAWQSWNLMVSWTVCVSFECHVIIHARGKVKNFCEYSPASSQSVQKCCVFHRLPSHDSLAGAMKLKIKKSEGLTAVAFDDYEMFLYHSYVPHEAAAELSEVGNL